MTANIDSASPKTPTRSALGQSAGSAFACSRCRELDKCLIMGRCLDQDERQAYFNKYGRWPNGQDEGSAPSQPNAGEKEQSNGS
jgi:hypothetical protein